MLTVNMRQTRMLLSRLVDAIEQGREREIFITRNGRLAAKLVPLSRMPTGQHIGVAKGLFEVPESIDDHSDEVTSLFTGKE